MDEAQTARAARGSEISPPRIAIIGGGIGGAAAAVALRRHGIDADVFEQAPAFEEVGAGVGLHPNGVRMMRQLGLGDALERVGARWTSATFRHSDGRELAPWWPPGIETIEVYSLHRADLLEILLAELDGARLHPGHRCAGVEQRADGVHVTFADGTAITADAVIGADGVHSVVREHVTTPTPVVDSGSVAFRGLVPAARIGWPAGQKVSWLGVGKHIMAFPVRAGELVAFAGFIAGDERMRESWSGAGSPERLRREFDGWDPNLLRLLDAVETTFWWGLYDREPLPNWTSGRVTLLGDAAHPMLPHVGQGAVQALEDAVTLAALLHAAGRDAIPAALERYERLRRTRTAEVQRSARANGRRYDADEEGRDRRDRELSDQTRYRRWMWDFDAAAEVAAAIAGEGR